MTPDQLAQELTITAKRLRAWLRVEYPRPAHEKWTAWELTSQQIAAARDRWGRDRRGETPAARKPLARSGGRASSDEAYVVDLCDRLLGEIGLRQHRFQWLRGDSGKTLPVDAYYPEAGIVIEYRERQHDRPAPHFDKPDRLTVSGVPRGEQRHRYDLRREEVIPKHALRLVVVKPDDLDADSHGRLKRHEQADLEVLRRLARR